MARWACTHPRLREFTYVELATDAELRRMIRLDRRWAGPAERELAARYSKCPACANQDRSIRRSLLVVVIVGLALLLLRLGSCRG